MKSFYISTFGCRVNQADSAVIRDDLRRYSLQETDSYLSADVVIVNSCTVTRNTDKQVQQLIRRIHRRNPNARIVVTGCYAEGNPTELGRVEGVNCVVGNADKINIAKIVEDELTNDGTYCGPVKIFHGAIDQDEELRLSTFMDIGGKTRPFLKIQDGCDARCSYCIIPFVRGAGRSADPDEILRRVQSLVASGYKEIVLTGIHLGTYGSKLEPKTTLAALIRRILDQTSLLRLRIGSVEPMRFSSQLVELASESPRIAPHFHLPLQSASNKILRMMRRSYALERFDLIIGKIRTKLPKASIGTDVIVGFPGETEEDFLQTYNYLKTSPLTYLHVFSYSRREGTYAADLPNQVEDRIIKHRSEALRKLSLEKSFEFRKNFLGRVVSVLTLAEDYNEGAKYISALTDNYLKVKLEDPCVKPNEILGARIVALGKDFLVGERV